MADEHAGEDAAAGRDREPAPEPASGKATGKTGAHGCVP